MMHLKIELTLLFVTFSLVLLFITFAFQYRKVSEIDKVDQALWKLKQLEIKFGEQSRLTNQLVEKYDHLISAIEGSQD